MANPSLQLLRPKTRLIFPHPISNLSVNLVTFTSRMDLGFDHFSPPSSCPGPGTISSHGITWMVSRLVSLLLLHSHSLPRGGICPHEGQIMSRLSVQTPQDASIFKGMKSNHKNRSLGPTWSITPSHASHPQSFLSLSLHRLSFPVLTPLKRAQPSYRSSLHTKPAFYLCHGAVPFSALIPGVLMTLPSSSLCSKLTRLSSLPCVPPYPKLQLPIHDPMPLSQGYFPHNTHPSYSIEVIWLLGLFLQSVMSTFEYKLHENGDFCLYCLLGLENISHIVDAQ